MSQMLNLSVFHRIYMLFIVLFENVCILADPNLTNLTSYGKSK